jgi:hypothetical protein
MQWLVAVIVSVFLNYTRLTTHLLASIPTYLPTTYIQITINAFIHTYTDTCRSQWPRGLRHELSSLVLTLGSWVRISLKVCMSVYAFILCLWCPVCR